MMVQGVSINEMLNQSIQVLTKPGVETFERFERHGGQREATIYIMIAAAISAIAALVFGLLNGIVVALLNAALGFILAVAGFYIFVFLVYFIGKQQGGTGTQDEVFYTMSLFVAPIQAVTGAVSAIPLIGCLALPATLALGIYQIYLGYLGARSSMNLDQNKAIITLVLAFIAQLFIGFIIAAIFGVIFAAFGVSSGAIELN
ncbi:MAG: YIP1 family protein [Roseiflexus sp.]|jgi:enoyl-CoA hydratase/carnithine racemase|uniref:Yip1 family protein n=1 Tax=Roseiflexus sp. TaxID=2562120 RepID=UPI0025D5DFDF|nr:Yip1 family protein [Roseiflexus sp.]MCL6541758.1 YIP1 family protein [Roseiflexus sp.]